MQDARFSPNYKWVALGITTIGVLMSSIDSTVVVLALPDMMAELNASLVSMVWVLMGYIFVSTVLLLALGRVADLYGRVRLYNLGFVVFTVGSALCGLSWTDGQLIGSRLVQGVGGALLVVNSLAIVTEVFPPSQRGTALGLNAITFATGAILGPILGGLILATTTWRWIFLINIPIGIVGTVLAYRYLREMPRPRRAERLDLIGSVAFTVSLLSLLFALMSGIDAGWTSPLVLGLFGLFLASLAFFVYWERKTPYPALDLTLFDSRLFDFSVLAATLQALAIFAVQFLIVFYLQAVRGYTPLSAAFMLMPLPIATAVMGPIGGRISDRIGARVPASVGLVIQAAALYWLSQITLDTPYQHIAIGLAMMGFGGGLFWSPNTSAAMSSAPTSQLGVAAATLATMRNTGMVTSFALALAVAASNIPRDQMLALFVGTAAHLGTPLMVAFVDGMTAAFRASVVICLLAAAMSLVRGPEQRREVPVGERESEEEEPAA